MTMYFARKLTFNKNSLHEWMKVILDDNNKYIGLEGRNVKINMKYGEWRISLYNWLVADGFG